MLYYSLQVYVRLKNSLERTRPDNYISSTYRYELRPDEKG